MKRRKETEGGEGKKLHDMGVLIAGASLGAGIALLTAPNTGEKVRRTLRRRYHKTMKRIDRSTENIRHQLEHLIHKANDARRAKVRQYLKDREAERRRPAA